jgi:DNA-binding transcriptional ArsR family regulator
MTQKAADSVFRAIADPARRQILQLLSVEAMTVGGICEHFAISQPAISQHMRVLRESGLVESHAEWRHRTYHLRPQNLKAAMDWMRHFEKFWDEALDRLDNVIDKMGPADV